MRLREQKLPVIFSLAHLSQITSVSYSLLHESVNRKREKANYTLFSINKRSGGKRYIHAVNGELINVHKFINECILENIPHHISSYAFHSDGGIKKCADMHAGCRWLFQFDLKDFFTSINEIDVYKVFLAAGYRSLLAFEMARLCTTLHLPKTLEEYLQPPRTHCGLHYYDNIEHSTPITVMPYHLQSKLGVLPQGAPTSPKLSNLVAAGLDVELHQYAKENGLVYTRYADDLALSAFELPAKKRVGQILFEVGSIIRRNGFTQNQTKTHISSPGSRKSVVGLLVDREYPRISKAMLKRIDRNIYSIEKFGPVLSASHDSFESTLGYINHVSGLLSYLKDVDKTKWSAYRMRYKRAMELYLKSQTMTD